MRIAVISAQVFTCPPPGYSGLEMIAYQCAKELAVLGHKVALFAPEGSSCPGVTCVTTGPPGKWDEHKAFLEAGKEMLTADVIIDHSWNKWSYQHKIQGIFKGPVLGVCHAPINTMYNSLPPVDKPCMVCISKDQSRALDGMFGEGKSRHSWNGIDLDFYKPISGMKRTNRFLFLARFSSIKGPDLALDVCEKLDRELDMVGDTFITQEPELFFQCKDRCDRSDGRRRMIGPCFRFETVYWFCRNHLLLHPIGNRFREPFGLSPIESMACGMPVVSFAYGALPETIRHGDTGWLAKTMPEYIEGVRVWGGEISDFRRKRCREWASQFSVQNMAKRYEELCMEALNNGGW